MIDCSVVSAHWLHYPLSLDDWTLVWFVGVLLLRARSEGELPRLSDGMSDTRTLSLLLISGSACLGGVFA